MTPLFWVCQESSNFNGFNHQPGQYKAIISNWSQLKATTLSTLETLQFDDFISPSHQTISFSKKQYIRRIFLGVFRSYLPKTAVSGWPLGLLILGDPGIIRNLHTPYSESTPPPSAIQHLPSHRWPNPDSRSQPQDAATFLGQQNARNIPTKRGRIRKILRKHLLKVWLCFF